MQQENSTDGRSNLPFDGSKLTIDDTVSTEFTLSNDEEIPGGHLKSNDGNNLAVRSGSSLEVVTSLPSYPSTIPSGATELPGLHGRIPLIWKWDSSISQPSRSAWKNQHRGRGERKSTDFASTDCNSSKNLDERSSTTSTGKVKVSNITS